MGAKKAELDSLAKKLVQLVEIFRRGGEAADFNWWHSRSGKSLFTPLYGYQDGESLYEEVAEGVLNLNSKMLSRHEVDTRITHDFLMGQATDWSEKNHLYNKKLLIEARQFLEDLIAFEAWQDIDIPIANLRIIGEQFQLANVTFMKITEQELEVWKNKTHMTWDSQPLDGHTIARVRAPGDQHNAISYARTQVNLVLDAFRAFCFPFISEAFSGQSASWQLEVVGDVIPLGSTPLRINENRFLARVGSGATQLTLEKNVLKKLEKSQWELIDKLILKTNRSKMETKLLDSVHWMSEATKPDTNNSKFVKISVALETLIGGEPEVEELKVRGITAMLAERAAFIAGKDLNDRLTIDKDIRKYYRMRGGIVHGGVADVSVDNINGFGKIVRRIAISLLEKPSELAAEVSDVDKLQAWVNKQKYTFPSSTDKEKIINAKS
jgi:hypothetical protein